MYKLSLGSPKYPGISAPPKYIPAKPVDKIVDTLP